MNYEKIGQFIQKRRKAKGLTQKELAEKLKVTDKAVSKWERGLGCPDVSILEVLATTLDVSILEILKGQKIENEMVKVTEMDDYVKDTLIYSNNHFKNIINKMITFIVIAITALLIILNIEQIIRVNKKYYYDFDTENMTSIKKQVSQIKENVTIIKNKQGKFKDEDYKNITDSLDDMINQIDNYKLLQYSGKQQLKLNDIYVLDITKISSMMGMKIISILEKYQKNEYFEPYKNLIMAKVYFETVEHEDIANSYKYQLLSTPNEIETTTISDDKINVRIRDIQAEISSYLYITNQIIKVGEINE